MLSLKYPLGIRDYFLLLPSLVNTDLQFSTWLGIMTIRKEDIAGVVVIYNSDNGVLENIESYKDQIAKLYIVDNSPTPNELLKEKFSAIKNTEYHAFKKNAGVAAALNFGASRAQADGFSILLTMDDDTKMQMHSIEQLLDFWNNYGGNIGILSGVHHSNKKTEYFNKLDYTLTSGNLLNLDAYRQIGPFREDFFIDHVDHEYGLRLNKSGYDVIEVPAVRLEHRLGYKQKLQVGPLTLGQFGNHPPIRLYYFARNGVYLARQQLLHRPLFSWMVTKELTKRFVKALLSGGDFKLRTEMLLRGVTDGLRGRLGPFQL